MGKLNKGRSPATRSNVPAMLDKELAAAAQRSLDRMKVPTQGSRMSIRGKQFTIGGVALGDEIKVAVVDFGYVHAFYSGAYNEKTPLPPVCFALSMNHNDLEPHSIAPDKQHGDCESCPKNAFGSATTGSGRGKACKDIVRLTVMHIDDLTSAESVGEGKLATLDLPAMSLKGWSAYSTSVVRKTQRELLGVVTALTFEEKPQYPVIEFALDGPIMDSGIIMALKRRQTEAGEMILTPWQPVSEEKRNSTPAPTGRQSTQRKSGSGRSRFS